MLLNNLGIVADIDLELMLNGFCIIRTIKNVENNEEIVSLDDYLKELESFKDSKNLDKAIRLITEMKRKKEIFKGI